MGADRLDRRGSRSTISGRPPRRRRRCRCCVWLMMQSTAMRGLADGAVADDQFALAAARGRTCESMHQQAGLHRLGDEIALDDGRRRPLDRLVGLGRDRRRRRRAGGPADRRCGRAGRARPARARLRRCRARCRRPRHPRCVVEQDAADRVAIEGEREADLAASRSAPARRGARRAQAGDEGDAVGHRFDAAELLRRGAERRVAARAARVARASASSSLGASVTAAAPGECGRDRPASSLRRTMVRPCSSMPAISAGIGAEVERAARRRAPRRAGARTMRCSSSESAAAVTTSTARRRPARAEPSRVSAGSVCSLLAEPVDEGGQRGCRRQTRSAGAGRCRPRARRPAPSGSLLGGGTVALDRGVGLGAQSAAISSRRLRQAAGALAASAALRACSTRLLALGGELPARALRPRARSASACRRCASASASSLSPAACRRATMAATGRKKKRPRIQTRTRKLTVWSASVHQSMHAWSV